jgi:hypothetical protein
LKPPGYQAPFSHGQLWVGGSQRAPGGPTTEYCHHPPSPSGASSRHLVVGLALPGVRLVTWTIQAVVNWCLRPYALLGSLRHSRVSDWLHGPYALSSTGAFDHTPGCQIDYMDHTRCRQLVFSTIPRLRLRKRVRPVPGSDALVLPAEVRSRQILRHARHHVVAVQVGFERQILKPVFHLIGYRLWV